MKAMSVVLSLFFSVNAFAVELSPQAKKACTEAFRQTILHIYSPTKAESVRMSRRVEYQPAESIDPNLELTETHANFYVKWPWNKNEVPELAGDRLAYDKTTGICQSIDLVEYGRLIKH